MDFATKEPTEHGKDFHLQYIDGLPCKLKSAFDFFVIFLYSYLGGILMDENKESIKDENAVLATEQMSFVDDKSQYMME